MSEVAVALKYEEVLAEYKKISDFFTNREIIYIERLPSIWRAENIVLKILCDDGCYVFKKINDTEKETEISRFRQLKYEYPSLLPDIFCHEKESYVMEFIEGRGFFDLDEKERAEKIHTAGRLLAQQYLMKNGNHKDIRGKIQKSFQRYRQKADRFFDKNELTDANLDAFKNVPDIASHNDLNAANLLYNNGFIKMIDPKEQEYNDIARDIGRYCASTFFNNYDRFGNNKKQSLEIAHAFLANFDEGLMQRARYYIGESFMSFLNFQTVTAPKTVLKKLAVNVLAKQQDVMKSLEESL